MWVPAELGDVDFSQELKNSGALLSYAVSIFAKVVNKACGVETPTLGDNASVIHGLYNLILKAVKAVRRVPITPAPVKNAAKAVEDGLEDPQVRGGPGAQGAILAACTRVMAQQHRRTHQLTSVTLSLPSCPHLLLGHILFCKQPSASGTEFPWHATCSLALAVMTLGCAQVKALEDALEEVIEQDKGTCKGAIMKRVKAFVTSEYFICFRAIIAR